MTLVIENATTENRAESSRILTSRRCKRISSDHSGVWPVPLVARSRRRSPTARLLRSWVQIPPGAWMSLCCNCCVLSGRGHCDELIICQGESYRVCCVVVCDLEISWMRRTWPTGGGGGGGGLLRQKNKKKQWGFQPVDLTVITFQWSEIYLLDASFLFDSKPQRLMGKMGD